MVKRNSKIISSAIISIIYLLAFLIVYSFFPFLTFSQNMINVLISDILATIVVLVFSFIFNKSGVYDVLAALFTFSAILTEWIADKQLHRFRKNNTEISFISSGIWNYSRHPNYLGEIGFWGGLFLFVISSTSLVSFTGYWTIIGFVSMVILFKFISIPMMEKRNKTKRPGYTKYINRVPALLPRFYHGKK